MALNYNDRDYVVHLFIWTFEKVVSIIIWNIENSGSFRYNISILLLVIILKILGEQISILVIISLDWLN